MFLTAICTLAACEEEIYFSNLKFKPKLVVNSIFTEDSIWAISITHTTNIFDDEAASSDNVVKDAQIEITDAAGLGICKFFFDEKDNLYKSYNCVSGNRSVYKIKVQSQQFGIVTAVSGIPSNAEISDIAYKSFDEANDSLSFKINTENDDNFYICSVVEFDKNSNTAIDKSIDVKTWLNQIKKRVNQSNPVKSHNSEVAYSFADIKTNNGGVNTQISVNSYTLAPDPESQIETVKKLRVMTVSPELFKYYKSIENYHKYNNFNSSEIDPQRIYTNVSGGLGVFAGYSVKYYNITN